MSGPGEEIPNREEEELRPFSRHEVPAGRGDRQLGVGQGPVHRQGHVEREERVAVAVEN
jgi:hypothetical protein